MENPFAIANFFINKASATGVEMTQMKLIKLVYISNGWYLALTGNPLIQEKTEAWKYGPVVPVIYHHFKRYLNGQINEPYRDPFGESPEILDSSIKNFLDKIWSVYGNYSGLQLSSLTHQTDTPWDIVWNQNGGCNQNAAIIDNEIIKAHYRKKIQPSQNLVNA